MNYAKYQLFFKNIDILLLELLNLSLVELAAGGIETVEQDNLENHYIYLSKKDEGKILDYIKYFCDNNRIDFYYKKIENINESYLFKWKENYKEIVINDIIIKPSWIEDKTYKDKVIIEIDPQTAFGTGHHETTQLAIKSLLSMNLTNKELIDVGTGSGIISLVANKKNIQKVYSFDNDYEAVKVAKENFSKNNFYDYNLFCGTMSALKNNKKFDIVIANIISSILLQFKDSLKEIVKPNGILILSGILADEKEKFISEFNFNGFLIKNILYLGEWICFILKKEQIQ